MVIFRAEEKLVTLWNENVKVNGLTSMHMTDAECHRLYFF